MTNPTMPALDEDDSVKWQTVCAAQPQLFDKRFRYPRMIEPFVPEFEYGVNFADIISLIPYTYIVMHLVFNKLR